MNDGYQPEAGSRTLTSALQRLLPLACEARAEAMRLAADSWPGTFAPYICFYVCIKC